MTENITTAQDSPGVSILPPQVLLGAAIASVIFNFLIPLGFNRGIGGFIFGVLLASGGIALLVTCWKLFKKHRNNVRPDQPAILLIQEGPYNYCRNPMYAGLILVYTGIAMLLGNFWFFTLLPAILAYLRFVVIAREEAYLTRRFEEEYLSYCCRVGRWI